MKALTQTSRVTALVLLALLVFAATLPVSRVQAQGSTTTTRKQPTTAAMQLVAGNGLRRAVLVQNVGTVIVSISSSSTITYTTGNLLAPNQRMIYVGSNDGLYGITNSGTADLRVTELASSGPGNTALASISLERLNTSGVSNDAANTTVPMSDGSNLVAGNVLVFLLTSAVTANSTTTSTTAGSLAITSNATGLGSIFQSDGTKWQLLANYSQYVLSTTFGTIATTSTSDIYVSAPVSGTLTGIDFSSIDALTANDTNFITWTVVNLGQSGVGTTAMLAVADSNTTKATGGTSLVAFARRQMTIHGTAGNLAVVKGDVIRFRATATGTLAGAVTGARGVFYFTRTV